MSINAKGTPPPINIDALPGTPSLGFTSATHSVSASSFINTHVDASVPSLSFAPINASANNNVNVTNSIPNLSISGLDADVVGIPELNDVEVTCSAPTLSLTPSSVFVDTLTPPDIIVAKSGGDYATIQAALNAANTGDIIEVQAQPAGSFEYFNETLTLPINGTNGNECILRGRAGDTIVCWTAPGTVLTLNNTSYWKFQNLQFGRDETLNGWSYSNGRLGVEHSRWASADPGTNHHITFEDCRMYGGRTYGQYHDSDDSTDHHTAFIRCKCTHQGSNESGKDGNLLAYKGSHGLFIDLDNQWGGHDTLHIETSWNVVRRGFFNGDWSDYSATYPGNRAFTLEGAKGNSPWGPNLVEGAIIKQTNQDNSGTATDPASKMGAKNLICRRNYIFDNRNAAGWDGEAFNTSALEPDGAPAMDGYRIYNNTCYRNGGIATTTDWNIANPNGDHYDPAYPNAGDGHYSDRKYKNNIFHETGKGRSAGNPSTADHIRLIVSSSDKGSYPDDWRGSVWDNNIIRREGNADIRVKLSGDGGATIDGLANVKAQWPNTFLSSNTTNAPTFANVGDRFSSNYATVVAAFGLQAGSEGKGTASALTQTDGAGSGTALTVDDSVWFYCGADPLTWDMGYFGEQGDIIKIGSGSPVQILAIDYTSHIITLAASRSWGDGDDVFLVDPDGSTVVDDLGATQ